VVVCSSAMVCEGVERGVIGHDSEELWSGLILLMCMCSSILSCTFAQFLFSTTTKEIKEELDLFSLFHFCTEAVFFLVLERLVHME
jgi:hypothetical protein